MRLRRQHRTTRAGLLEDSAGSAYAEGTAACKHAAHLEWHEPTPDEAGAPRRLRGAEDRAPLVNPLVPRAADAAPSLFE